MRLIIWMLVAAVLVWVFAGDNLRSYFKRDVTVVAQPSSPDEAKSDNSEKPSPPKSYVPSPADAPELYESPTRRFGI